MKDSPIATKNKVIRLSSFLLFIVILFLIILKSNYPSNLHPAAYWFNARADSLDWGDNFWIRLLLNEPTIEARRTSFAEQHQYQLKNIAYGFIDHTSRLTPPKTVCIDKLIVSERIEFGSDVLEGHEPICSIVSKNENGFFTTMVDIEAETNQEIYYDVTLNFNTFYYPFVKSTNLLILQIKYHTVDENNNASEGKTITPGVEIYLDSQSQWDIEINEQNRILPNELPSSSSFLAEGEIAVVEIKISGPLYSQTLSIFLIFGMIVLIALTFTIKSTSSFIQAIAAILFGLYGVRQILTPQDIQVKTILDVVFVLLYSFAIYTSIDHVLLKFIYSREAKGINYQLVSSFSSNIYHRVTCSYLEKIPENNRLYFKNEQEAKERNLKNCKRCVK